MDVRILAIDPGSAVVGFACIDVKKPFFPSPSNCTVVDCGVIRPPVKESYLGRLSIIQKSVASLTQELSPNICSLEAGYVGINLSTSLKLGEVRGVVMSCWLGMEVPLYTYSPREVKQVVSGKGSSSKESVSFALQQLIGFDGSELPYDATDALAVAICCGLDPGAVPLK